MRMLAVVTTIALTITAPATSAPRSLIPDGWRARAANGPGGQQVFVSPDGEAVLRTGHVARRGSLSQDMDMLAYRTGETITYHRRGASWIAVSGYREGQIFYRKSNLACRGSRWNTIELQYPRRLKERLDSVVTAIARNMGGYGSDC